MPGETLSGHVPAEQQQEAVTHCSSSIKRLQWLQWLQTGTTGATGTTWTMCWIMASNQRVLSAVRNGPVRRSLFGPVDSEQLRRDYRAALDKDLREASSRWSFDFVRDRPLEHGDFQWEGVPGAKVPLLYRSSVDDHQVAPERRDQAALEVKQVKQVKQAKQVESESESEKENHVPGSPRRHAVNLLKLEKTPEKDQRAGLKRKQTNITDFYEAKRRVVWMPRKSGQ